MKQLVHASHKPDRSANRAYTDATDSEMLSHLQRLAIVGVWGPVLFMCVWLGSSVLVGSLSPSGSAIAAVAGGFLAFGWVFLGFAAAHLLLASSALGFGLLAIHRAARPATTLASSLVGTSLAAVVLLPVYFNVKVL